MSTVTGPFIRLILTVAPITLDLGQVPARATHFALPRDPAHPCGRRYGQASIAAHTCLRRTPHPVIVTIRDSSNYIWVLLYSYYTTLTEWGVLLTHVHQGAKVASPARSTWDLFIEGNLKPPAGRLPP